MEANREPEVTITTAKRPRKASKFYVTSQTIVDPDSKRTVSLIKVDVKPANKNINIIPSEGDRLSYLRENIFKALETSLNIQLTPQFRDAFMFQLDKEIIPQPKESMELEKCLQEAYPKHPKCFNGDMAIIRFNIIDVDIQYQFLKLLLPRMRRMTTVAVFIVKQLTRDGKDLKNRVIRIEHNPDYYSFDICNIRGDLKDSHILRSLTIETIGKTTFKQQEHYVLRFSKTSDSKEYELHIEDIFFNEEAEMQQFLNELDALRKIQEESDNEDNIPPEEGKLPSLEQLDSKSSSRSKSSHQDNLVLSSVGSLQDIGPVDSIKQPGELEPIEERKISGQSRFLKRFNSEGRIESEIQKVLREKQSLKLESQEFAVKVHGIFGIKQKRILRLNEDFEFVFFKKEKENDMEMYSYTSHIPMNDVLKVRPRDTGNSKVIFLFKSEKKYSKPLKIDFEKEQDGVAFFELMKMIIKLFQSSNNSFKTEKDQQENDKMYPWLIGPKQDQLLVEFEHGQMKTIQFKVVNVSNFGESQIAQINLLNSILSLKLADGTIEKRIGLRDVLYCEADFKDPRGLRLVLKNKKYALLFCDTRSRLMFEAAVYDAILPQYKLALIKKFEPETLKVYCSSFNSGFARPNKSLDQWLQKSKDCHIIAIAMQESDTADWLEAIEMYYTGEKFVLVTLVTMWKMLLCVFVASQYAPFVTNIEVGTKATGIADIIGNKGGVAISFRVLETSFCFIGAHLAAQPDNVPVRKANFYNIMKYLRLGDEQLESTAVYDYVYFIADANFRLDCNFFQVLNMINKGQIEDLLPYDQLLKARDFDNFMTMFDEGKLTFKPTYRRNREDSGYSNKKNQSPSWTDRVLIKSRPNKQAVIQEYSSVEMFFMSDHRPVYCITECKVDYPYIPKRPLYIRDPNLVGIVKFTELVLHYNFALHDQMNDLEESISSPSNIAIHFRARFLSKFAITVPIQLKGPMKTITWKPEMIPLLYCVIADNKYLRNCNLLALIKVFQEEDEYEAMIGQADISLQSLVDNQGSKTEFKADIHLYGRKFGTLSGSFMYELP